MFTIEVYLIDGRVAVMQIDSEIKAREIAGQVFKNNHVRLNTADDVLEYYPMHQISKVKITGPFTTHYKVTWRGT